jgi:hypothetical protein
MFPLNTILAWNINIIKNKNMIIITTLLLPLGHISFIMTKRENIEIVLVSSKVFQGMFERVTELLNNNLDLLNCIDKVLYWKCLILWKSRVSEVLQN